VLREKSLEGAPAFFAGSIAVGAVVASVTELTLLYVLVGGAVGTLTELFVRRVDDNFAVSLMTGGALTAFEMLGTRV